MSLLDTLITRGVGSVKGLGNHLQDTEKLGQIGLSPQDYNVISAMNAADNMNAGLTSLMAPAALYSIGDTISNTNQSLPEGISDFGRYMKGVNIQSNPELAKQLMGEKYVNQMQGKYALAMDEIGKGIFGKGPDPSIYGSPSNTGIMSTPYIDRIMDPGSMRAAAYRSIENEPYEEIPGFNFIDAPTSLKSRIQNPEFLNNPRTGIIDNLIMQRGNPGNTIIDKAKSGFGKGVNLGKAALSGILSLATGVPFLGNALTGIASQFENRPLEAGVIDESGNFYDPEQLNKMNALGGYYTDPARSARRRSKRIARMLERQKLGKKISQKNLEKLQAQEKAQEAAQRKAMDAMFARGEGGSGQDFTGGRYDGAGSQAGYDANPTGFSGSS